MADAGAKGPAAPKTGLKSTMVGIAPPTAPLPGAPAVARPAQAAQPAKPIGPVAPKAPLQPAHPSPVAPARTAGAVRPMAPSKPDLGPQVPLRPMAPSRADGGPQAPLPPMAPSKPDVVSPALPAAAPSKPDVVPPPLPAATPSKPDVTPPPLGLTPAVPRTEEVRTPPTPPAVLEAALAAEPKASVVAEPVRPRPIPESQARLPQEPREDTRALIRAALDEAVAPLHRAISLLEHRLAEVERRPAQTIVQQVVQPAPAVATSAAAAPRPQLHTQPQVFATAAATPAAVLAPRAAPIDLSAIDVSIEMNGALDGKRRKRRIVGTLVVAILVVFGGLFGALFRSYQPH